MKKILVSLAALLVAVTTVSAQSMAEATETAKLANESLSAGDLGTALDGFKMALVMAQACGDEGAELVSTCQGIIPKIMNNLAKGLYNEKNYDEAIAKYEETIAVAKEYGDEDTAAKAESMIPQIYVEKGKALNSAKDFEGAVEAFRKSLELNPTNGNVALRLGMALESAGKGDEAIEAYKLAAANGQEKNANAQIGKHYLKIAVDELKGKKYADAAKDALTSLEYAETPQAYQVAGQASQLSGKNADAVKYFEKYLELAPNAKNAGQIAYTIGVLEMQAKNNAKAKEYLTKALSDPKYGEDAKKALSIIK